jgi:hypothetical protein
MSKIAITAAAAAALAALPAAGAAARPGAGHGQGQGPGAHQRPADLVRQPKPRGRCSRAQRVAFVAHGSFVAFAATADPADALTAGDLTVDVTRSNHHARGSRGQHTFATAGAKVTFRGVNDSSGNGAVGLEDVVAGDRVVLLGKLVRPKRGCQGQTSVLLRKVMVKRPAATQQG